MDTSGTAHDKHQDRFQRFRPGRLGCGAVPKTAKRDARIERDAEHNAQHRAETISPAGVFTGVGAGIALIFSVMAWISSSAQDKVDKGTGPLSVQLNEMDRRLTGRLDAVDKRLTEGLAAVDKRLDRIEAHADRMDERLTRVESTLTRFDQRFDAIERKLDQLVRRR